jgi:hypothetical protein
VRLRHILSLVSCAALVAAACARAADSDTGGVDDDATGSGGDAGQGMGGSGAAGPGPAGPGSGGAGNTPGPGSGGNEGGAGPSSGGGPGSGGSGLGSGGAGSSGGGGSAPVCSDLFATGGGFEDGPMGGYWVESSISFGTPLCDLAGCGTGGGTGPASGTWWFWGGGTNVQAETAYVEKTIVIPSGTATLSWQLEIPSCDGFGFDTFEVRVDGTPLFATDDTDATCDSVGYVTKTLNLNAYANGAAHTIRFHADTDSIFVPTNFMVDDVELVACN